MPRNDDFRIDSDNVVDDVETDDAVSESDGKAWPPVMERKDVGFESGDDVEIKDASGDVAVTIKETADPFKFRIIGGVTGLVDRVNDVVEVGAYTKTLKARTPKIIKDHEWSQRLGKVLSIKELAPGDPELPETVADGSLWPKTAGALVADVQLFKKSQAGQEAAERWREYGRDQQFSIGYRVPAGMAVKSKDGVRHIKELDLYEISDVLWGAAPDSTLLPSVLATKVLAGVEMESKGEKPEDEEDVETVESVESNEPETEADTETDDEEDNTEPPVTHAPFDDDEADFDIEEVDFDSDEIDAEAFDTFGDEIAATVPDSDIERGDTPETAAPSTSDAGAHTADTLDDGVAPPQEAPDNAAVVDATVDGTDGANTDTPETAAPSTGDEVENVAEKALGAIESHVELRAALRTYEAASDAEKALYGPYIATSADAAGIAFLLPEDLAAIDVKSIQVEQPHNEPDDLSRKYNTAPLGHGNNYVTQEGGLDPFIRAVSHSLIESGHSKSRAIALAIGSMKRWARGGGNVTPKTRAKAVKALASWEALKARAKARPNKKSIEPVDENAPNTVEPVDTEQAEADTLEAPVDREEATGSAERKSMMVPFFAGSQEELRSLVCAALWESAELGQFEGRPQVVGTFDNYVIVTVWPEISGPAPMPVDADYSTYKVEFDYDAESGTVELGKVDRIRITTKTSTDSTGDDDLTEVLGGLDAETSDGADSVKHAVTMLDLESKAGRVLSSSNANALKSAYEALGDLLKRAGVDVEGSDGDVTDGDPVTDETDVAEKTGEEATAELVPFEHTDEYKILQLMRIQSAARTRTLNN